MKYVPEVALPNRFKLPLILTSPLKPVFPVIVIVPPVIFVDTKFVVVALVETN